MKINLKTKSFRKIPNPFYTLENSINSSEMYMLICDVKDVPKGIPMETNPREQRLTTAVAKKIRASLINEKAHTFYLLNRGLTLSAKSITYDNKNDIATLEFEDLDIHGNIDGGHTYKIILEEQENLDYGEQFVKIEVLTGVEDFFQELASARNTSVQVQDKSIAELENRFDIIKNSISNEPYLKNIYFRENERGEIDVADIIAILNLFNIEKYPNKSENPIISYSGKGQCIKNYINIHKDYENVINKNPYTKMTKVMPDIFRLYDYLEKNMRKYYSNGVSNKKYGAVTGVTTRKDGRDTFKTKFYKESIDHLTPNGFLYPILGAFRVLLKEEDEVYKWKVNPFQVMDKIGPELVASTINMSRELGNNPNATGKNKTLWMNLYMMVCMELIEN